MGEHTPEKVADLTDAEWREFQSIPEQGYSHRHWVNHKIAQRLEAVSAERDEALVVIGAIRLLLPKPMSEPLSRDFTGRPFPRTIDGDQVARILSRIPEHPKED